MGIYHIGEGEMAMIAGPAKASLVGEIAAVVQIEQPTISALEPSAAACGDPDLQLVVTGTNFNELSKIVFNGYDEPTTLLSPTQVRTNVKPSLFAVPCELPVKVRTGSKVSEELTFTFTEAGAARSRRR